MADYKDFTYNSPSDPEPWGTVENQLDFDIIDTLVGDCISDAKDTSGHKHDKVYDEDGVLAVRADNDDRLVTIGLAEDDPSAVSDGSTDIIIGPSGTSHLKVETGQGTELFNVSPSAIDVGSDGASTVNIGSQSGQINIGNGTNIIDVELVEDQGSAMTIGDGTDNYITVDTSAEVVKIGPKGSTIPVVFENDGDAYSREISDVDYLCDGMTVALGSVKVKTLGSLCEVHILLHGTSAVAATQVSVDVPFKPFHLDPVNEVELGATAIYQDGVPAVVRVHFAMGDDNPQIIFDSVDPEKTTTINSIFLFFISDPNFTNELAIPS